MIIEQLNADLGINGQLEFVEGEGGFVYAQVSNRAAQARVCTYSGQVLSYHPVDQRADLLFVSDAAYFQPGKAIKGGIPVCWPWFGPDPANAGRPAHGFARNRQWQVIDSEALGDGETLLVLGLESDDDTRRLWPNDFELRIEIRIGRTLEIALMTVNKTTHSIALTQALHTYFKVGDVRQCEVYGLEAHPYVDKVDAGALKTQQGPVTISDEVDRIYSEVETDLVIDDPELDRSVRIRAVGSRSTVVWNPWVAKSAAMGDFGDEEYLGMICVETANAGSDVVTIAPGHDYRLVARYSIESR